MSRETLNLYHLHVTESEWKKIKEILPDIQLGRLEEIETSCKCDVCGKDIPNHSKYFSVRMGHHDWGSESSESYEWYDCCTCECATKLYEKYEEMKSDTKHIEIECKILKMKGGKKT